MRLRRRHNEEPAAAAFRWEEIACDSEAAAAAEAGRRQLTEDPAVVEWIYLHSDATGQWLARRTPRHIPPPKTTWFEAVVDAVLRGG
jgi:hypothetical protein